MTTSITMSMTMGMTTGLQLDVQDTPDQSQAQQMAASELAKAKYHNLPPAQGTSTVMPTIGAPTTPPPPPPPQSSSSTTTSNPTVILVIIGAIALVLILVFVLRAVGKPRGEKKEKKTKTKAVPSSAEAPAFEEVLVGAARHRRNAENAATAGQWAEAIRERFRAVIGTLDERGLLPERPERTADEAARDAGEVLPTHREPLEAAARAFDEVEYGEYLGSAEGYARIRSVDEQIAASAAATTARGLPAVRR